jgi:hypothetical protein
VLNNNNDNSNLTPKRKNGGGVNNNNNDNSNLTPKRKKGGGVVEEHQRERALEGTRLGDSKGSIERSIRENNKSESSLEHFEDESDNEFLEVCSGDGDDDLSDTSYWSFVSVSPPAGVRNTRRRRRRE